MILVKQPDFLESIVGLQPLIDKENGKEIKGVEGS